MKGKGGGAEVGAEEVEDKEGGRRERGGGEGRRVE
jgi:hypothetical protein